jgi:hypothetical protein
MGGVDAEPEGTGGHHHDIAACELPVRGVTLRCWQRPVVGKRSSASVIQRGGEPLGVVAPADVDKACAGPAERLLDRGFLKCLARAVADDSQVDVAALGGGHDLHRVGHLEHPCDLPADVGRGGGGRRQHGRRSQFSPHRAQGEVVGSEVGPPQVDAMGLVDDQSIQATLPKDRAHVPPGELFGGKQHELHPRFRQPCQRRGPSAGTPQRADHDGVTNVQAADAGDLVLLQRDQR